MLCAKNAFNDKPLTSMQIMHPHTVFLLGIAYTFMYKMRAHTVYVRSKHILSYLYRFSHRRRASIEDTSSALHLPVLQLILRAWINHRSDVASHPMNMFVRMRGDETEYRVCVPLSRWNSNARTCNLVVVCSQFCPV